MNANRPLIRANRSGGSIQAVRQSSASAREQRAATIKAHPAEVVMGPARRAVVSIAARRSVVEHVVTTGAPTIITLATELRGSYLAAAGVSGGRVVRTIADGSVIHASVDDAAGAEAVQGIARANAASGAPVSVQRIGKMQDLAWSWIPEKPVFLAADGQLTQAFDSSVTFWLQVGTAITPTVLDVRIDRPVHNSGAGSELQVSLSPSGALEAKRPGYEHVQGTPATVWHINHGLGRYPSGISVISSAGELVDGGVAYLDANHVDLSFSWPFSGRAHLN